VASVQLLDISGDLDAVDHERVHVSRDVETVHMGVDDLDVSKAHVTQSGAGEIDAMEARSGEILLEELTHRSDRIGRRSSP
jgi:hypothetical protein